MKVCFLLPDLSLSGGVGVVVQHARRLASEHGMEVALALVQPPARAAWAYPGLDAVRAAPLHELRQERWDVAVATWWATAYRLPEVRARRRAYFVQSLEDRFYAQGAPERALAALTHDLPVAFMTEAGWIADFLRAHRPDAACHLIRNGVDKEAFAGPPTIGARRPGPLRIVVEGHPEVWYKGVPEALRATSLMREPRLVTQVTPDAPAPGTRPGADRLVGPLSAPELAALLAESDVLLKLSRVEGMAGPPLEAFHMGATCVTTPVTGHDEYVRHGENALVVGWDDPHGTARTLDLLARDPALLQRLREGALRTARDWPDWAASSARMAEALRAIASSDQVPRDEQLEALLADAEGQVAALHATTVRAQVKAEAAREREHAAHRDTLEELVRWRARALALHARLHEREADLAVVQASQAYRLGLRLRHLGQRRTLRPLARGARWLLAHRGR